MHEESGEYKAFLTYIIDGFGYSNIENLSSDSIVYWCLVYF